jgi:DNA modification methylase
MTVRILEGDCRELLRTLPDESVHCIVTSPPYFGLRDYGVDGQMGLEATPEEFVAGMAAVFHECRRVLRKDGTLWLNIGDSYAGAPGGWQGKNGQRASRTFTARIDHDKRGGVAKAKDLIGIPWMLAFALRADGWYLRQDIIWAKPNPMPESVTDRCTKSHEYVFLLSKSARYYFDADAIRTETEWDVSDTKMPDGWDSGEGGHGSFHRNGREKGARVRGLPPRHSQYESSDQSGLDEAPRGRGANKRSVWTIATQPFKEAHFATFPPALVEPCILAGCPQGGVCLDPFGGAGTTGLVADRLQRDAILIELNPEYAEIARRRIRGDSPLFTQEAVSA